MRKALIGLAVVAALLAFASAPAFAVGITGTPHDLKGAGYGSTEICIFCHTPHNAKTTNVYAPLWNHTSTTQSYTLYGGGQTSKGTLVNQPGNESKACLSCHDGTVGIDAYGNHTPTPVLMTGAALMSSDLSDDHPVGVEFTPGSPGYKTPSVAKVLASGRVECASCHNAHDNASGDFLRGSNNASALCLDCHDK